MKTTVRVLLVTLFGAVTSLVSAILLLWAERHWNIALYSAMVACMIPVGAIGLGFIAASGYYLGAVFFNHKMQKSILLNMLAVSLGIYFFIQYSDYLYLKVEGRQVSDVVSFREYWEISTTHTTVQFRHGRKYVGNQLTYIPFGKPVVLGRFGYVYALFQVFGFALGGFFTYIHLASRLYCDTCSRYYANKARASRYIGDTEAFNQLIAKFRGLMQEQKFADLISVHATEAGDVKFDSKKHNLRIDVVIQSCKGCAKHHLGVNAYEACRRCGWRKMKWRSFGTFTESQLALSK